ncbi:MAG: peroxiredoxin [Thermoplasmata archaeon]|nr:peroxiredoxin [Thermoplasmata archaeon]
MIAVGDLAPDFEGVTDRGDRLRLSSLRGHPVVVYFYPKAGSMGCTRESQEFAHRYPLFREKQVEVIGVSVDDVASQRRFQERCSLPFALIADHDREISRAYGVLGAFGLARRVTFVVDPKGRVVHLVESILPGPHASGVATWLASEGTESAKHEDR